MRSFMRWVHSVVTRRKSQAASTFMAYSLRLGAVKATLGHGRARADLRLERRGGGCVRLVARPRGPERRDAARRAAVAVGARPGARREAAAAAPHGGPGDRGCGHRAAG